MHKTVVSKLVSTIIIIVFLVLTLPEVCSAQDYQRTYFLIKGASTYRLTLSTTSSLYEYYQQKSHQLSQDSFASFVTPYSLALVAEDVRSIFPDEEDFVNAALMFVHQIPYEVVEGAKYPVETLVENKGDCDLFSYLASSLMKAQGMDVVLLYCRQESHMNVGVNLSTPPKDARTTVTFVDYGGTRYYMAECTGDDWQNGWRVGECPPELEGAQVTVVTLDGCEQIAPGQVSSSFGALASSVVSLTVSPSFLMEGSAVVMAGQVGVSNPSGTVTLYATTGSDWFFVGTVELDSNGRYAFSWKPPLWGQHHVKASWSGNDEYAGADSGIVSVFVAPKILVLAGGGIIIITLVAVVIFLMQRTTHPQEIQTFEATSP